jgi:hypothetical protein
MSEKARPIQGDFFAGRRRDNMKMGLLQEVDDDIN